MTSFATAVNTLFDEVSHLVILGLTGRTGSGCTTAANILCTVTPNVPQTSSIYTAHNDNLKLKIVSKYVKENWVPFKCISIRNVITAFILTLTYEELVAFIAKVTDRHAGDVESELADFKLEYDAKHSLVSLYKALRDENDAEKKEKKEKAWEIYFDVLPKFSEKFKGILQEKIGPDAYVKIYQKAGDNIRASGKANDSTFRPENLFLLPRVISQIIKVVESRLKEKTLIVIDAIRNPYEAEFFKQRYANFYLVSINTPNNERLKHLRESHKFSEQQITALDAKEYPKKLTGEGVFVSQNIQKCIEISDIHTNNPSREKYNDKELACQLYWYVALILHPGLITPTGSERAMQLAYSAKLNSGCISRQVGAVITDSSHSVKAVGWNSVPEGQVPCLLRDVNELLAGGDAHTYSSYERTSDEFRGVLEATFRGTVESKELRGRNLSYCFKDLHNEVEGEKNQVHTRSLHAEENAFLQIAKYGGQPIKDGVLFTTASPCELCSKKAYQLGISKVVYIDPYPGIANDHILSCGKNKPELVLFSGAVGRAYHRLYQPLMPYKDEIKLLTEYTVSGGVKKSKRELKYKSLEEENVALKKRIAELEGEMKGPKSS